MGRIAIVDGVRTPFVKAWTLFEGMPAQRLGAIAVRELLEMTHLDARSVDEVILGSVAQSPEASNIARIVSLYAGIPVEKRAYTISRNCASGIESVTSASEKIKTALDEIVISGGTESMSNMPLLYGKKMTKVFMRLNRAKSIFEKLGLLLSIRPSHFKPIIALQLGLTDPVCGLNMGQTAEVLAKEYGISRKEQDEFALMSHKRAIDARDRLKEEIVPVAVAPKFKDMVDSDNGPREGQTIEALEKLKPIFDRHTGTVTVGNSCQVTDGACALLVMDEDKAKALGYKPLGYLKSYTYVGVEPSKMGIGPAYAIPEVLKKSGIDLKDIDLVEINEAFAVQVLACLKQLYSDGYDVGIEKLNVNGGAIALGHPVGVTGSRLILTILKELERRGKSLGLISLCVGGGQGAAIILER